MYSIIKEFEADTIFSLTPIKYLNYTYDGDDYGYLTSYTDPINIFVDLDMIYPKQSKFIIESGNRKDNEIKRFEYEIENQNRFVNRLYDMAYEKDLRFLQDMHFNNGFRWEMQKGKKSVAEFNYNHKIKKNKYLKDTDIYLSGNTNKEYNVAGKYKGVIFGKKYKDKKHMFYIGYSKNGK